MAKRLFDLLFNKPTMKTKILVDIDESKNVMQMQIDGDMPCVLTGLSILVDKLKENKIPEELIKGAVEIGLGKIKEENKSKVEVKEIHISKENEEELKSFLNKLMKGEL